MPRHTPPKNLYIRARRIRTAILETRLSRERYGLAAQKRAREKAAEADLDYDDPALLEARRQLLGARIDGEVARLHAEVAGYIRNGGLPPTDSQRAAQRETDEERRGWAMIEDILRGR